MIKDSNSVKIGKMLQKRYIIALSIIALLVVSSQVMIQYTIAAQEDDSRVVNISGRQRMLSQRINKSAFGLYISTDIQDQNRYSKELGNSLELWQKSHDGLLYGDAEFGLPGRNSEKVIEMFVSIEDEYQRIVGAVKAIQKITADQNYEREKLSDKIRIIQDNEAAFLKGMDAIVFQYDAESKEKIALIRLTELAILFVTFFTLLMEILFIFRPAQIQIENSLAEIETHRDEMEKLFETAPSALLLIDKENHKVIKLNHLAQELLHSLQNDLSGMDIYEILKLNQKDTEQLTTAFQSGNVVENLEIVVNADHGNSQVMLVSSNAMNYDEKRTILMGLADITKLKEAEEVLKKYASTDEMTGLLNKRSGMLVLRNIFAHAHEAKEDFCVCFTDIDGLKDVNDSYGHDEGDFYIKTVSQVIKTNLNVSDSVFRYGGDEIVMILQSCDRDQAAAVLHRIENVLKETSVTLCKPYRLRFSFGLVSLKENPVESVEELLQIADREMYKEKQRNRNDSIINLST
jgi:diguanylate cyclase (GGDEF)-like protein/PAS domain S-box-containing protein